MARNALVVPNWYLAMGPSSWMLSTFQFLINIPGVAECRFRCQCFHSRQWHCKDYKKYLQGMCALEPTTRECAYQRTTRHAAGFAISGRHVDPPMPMGYACWVRPE